MIRNGGILELNLLHIYLICLEDTLISLLLQQQQQQNNKRLLETRLIIVLATSFMPVLI